jgi:hypothetical protein
MECDKKRTHLGLRRERPPRVKTPVARQSLLPCLTTRPLPAAVKEKKRTKCLKHGKVGRGEVERAGDLFVKNLKSRESCSVQQVVGADWLEP